MHTQRGGSGIVLVIAMLVGARVALGQPSVSAERTASPWAFAADRRVRELSGQGRREEMLVLLRQSLRRAESESGPSSIDASIFRSGLGNWYLGSGDYTLAIPEFLHSVEILEKRLGPSSPVLAVVLKNLGEAHLRLQHVDDALREARRALAIQQGGTPPDDELIAQTLGVLALAESAAGKRDEAKRHYKEALEIQKRLLVASHPDTLRTMINLARLCYDTDERECAVGMLDEAIDRAPPDSVAMGMALGLRATIAFDRRDFERAHADYERQLAISIQRGGPRHPEVGIALANLASVALWRGDVDAAVDYQQRSIAIRQDEVSRHLTFGSERQKSRVLANYKSQNDAVLAMHARMAPRHTAARRLALNVALNAKGRLLDAMIGEMAALRRNTDAEGRELLDRWASLNAKASRQDVESVEVMPPRDGVALLAERDKIEEQLAQRISLFRFIAGTISVDDVQRVLPRNAAYVDIIVYRTFGSSTYRPEGPRHYLAFVVYPDRAPQSVDLGESSPIDHDIDEWVRLVRSDDIDQYRAVVRRLSEAVVAPILDLAKGSSHLVVSPDGMLNVLPWAALQDRSGRELVEAHAISYVTSARDLVRADDSSATREPAIVADPAFDAQGQSGKVRGAPRRSFDALPGTKDEALELEKILTVHALVGREATEGAVKRLQNPRLLHIATHGYFDRSLRVGRAGTDEEQHDLALDALLRGGGIALAGANAGGVEGEDGLLTALEASSLALPGTRLVTLSACESGLGGETIGEGIFGFRRALAIAGARAQLVSLWKVDDQATKQFMIAFYQRLVHGMGIAEAVRESQLEIRRREAWQRPFFWAPFLLTGKWEPVVGLVAK